MHAYLIFLRLDGRICVKTAVAKTRLYAIYGVLAAVGGICVNAPTIPLEIDRN